MYMAIDCSGASIWCQVDFRKKNEAATRKAERERSGFGVGDRLSQIIHFTHNASLTQVSESKCYSADPLIPRRRWGALWAVVVRRRHAGTPAWGGPAYTPRAGGGRGMDAWRRRYSGGAGGGMDAADGTPAGSSEGRGRGWRA